MRKVIALTFLLIAFFILSAAETRADTIVITSGYYFVSNPFLINPKFVTSSFDLQGNNFRARGGEGDGPGEHVSSTCPLPCKAGSTFSINTTASLFTDLPSSLTTNGQTYTLGRFGAALAFSTGNMIIPADASTVNGAHTTLTTNFNMTGPVSYSLLDPNIPNFFSAQLSGSGIATIDLWYSAVAGEFHISQITFNFQPAAATPEPATLILLGTGLAGVAAARRRRRGRP